MPAFNNQQLNYLVQNGNSVTIMIGDVVVGFGQTATPSIDWGTEQLYGIGSSLPQDIQQLKINPNISVDSFLLTATGLAILGYPGSILEVLSNNSFDITIIGLDGQPLLTYVGCVASNHNLNIPANAVVTETINFLCQDVLDNNGQTVLEGQNSSPGTNAIGGALNTLGL
jgi:hypothetical protein